MKTYFSKVLFILVTLCLFLSIAPTIYADNQIVMTADEFIGYLQYVVDRGDSRYDSGDVQSIGKYDGTYIYFDCWGLGESIICSKGKIVNNYNTSLDPWTLFDTSCGCRSREGDWIETQCESVSSDFSDLVPGEWLFRHYPNGARDSSGWACYHVGYYIGNGYVIESTSDGSYNTQISTIDSNGKSNIRGSSWTWTYHGKVPWINYDGSSSFTVRNKYDCDLTAVPNGVVKVWSMPGNTSTYPESSVIYNIGSPFKVTKIIENAASEAGHYWYQMKTPDGITGYVWSENVSSTSQRWSISASGVNKPENLSMTSGHSQTWPCTGTLSTGGSVITDVQGFIYSGNSVSGSAVTSSAIKHPHATSCNLNIIDDSMLFDAVTQSGYYTYVVKAKLKSAELINGALSETTSDWVIIEDTRSYYYVGNSTPTTYAINVRCTVDGESRDNLTGVGAFDIYINGSLDASNVSVYPGSWPSGTEYEIKNIRGFGYQYVPAPASGIKGQIGNSDAYISVIFTTIPQYSDAATTRTDFNNGYHQYERYDYHLTWTEAKTFCESKGGHLATITSEQEQAVVEDLLSACPFGLYYLGGTDMNQSGNWSWITGETFTYENWDKAYPEPSKDLGEYYNAIIGIDNPPNKSFGEWIDIPDDESNGFYSKINSGFICEYEQEQKSYTVSYNANGGTDAPSSQIKYEGQSILLSDEWPSREGYRFDGWALSDSATEPDYYPYGVFNIDANTTLYAVWTKCWVITYDSNGGEDNPYYSYVPIGESFEFSGLEPSYAEHEFLGWAKNRNAEFAEYRQGDVILLTSDITLYAVWKEIKYSEWTDNNPAGISASLVETKMQYRYSDYETTTSTDSTLDGWTNTGKTVIAYGDYGAWSDWSTNAVGQSSTREVQTTTMYRYYYFYCPVCGRHEPFQGTSDCGQYSLSSSDSRVGWFTTPYSQSNYKSFSYTKSKYYTNSLGDGQDWCFSAGNLNSTAIGTKDTDSDAIVITTGYRYRTRSETTVNVFERWTDWSLWSDTPLTSSDTRRVESRIMYRYSYPSIDRILTLPSAMMIIEKEAFSGVAAEGVKIPNSVTSIIDGAITSPFVIGTPESEAEHYAERNELIFIDINDFMND